jgi:hypothetical protein
MTDIVHDGKPQERKANKFPENRENIRDFPVFVVRLSNKAKPSGFFNWQRHLNYKSALRLFDDKRETFISCMS